MTVGTGKSGYHLNIDSDSKPKKMKTNFTTVLLTGLLPILVLQGARADEASANAMVISCSECAITWASQPDRPGKSITYRTDKSISCDACAADAANFLATHKFVRTCTNCGEHMACKLQQADVTPPVPSPTGSSIECSVMCAACQAVWLKTATEPGKLSTYWFARKDICRGCQDMAIEMIHTGKPYGVCAKCGETLRNRTPYALASRIAKAQARTTIHATLANVVEP